ncbi:family 3 adenylate cyclase [Sanguibacter keddieii DSM 10542]|uniref:Family 3 adenylate cyclase n=1 Tax=Sanguibacter keddieii (strain ATCC 51767 / DSM 10542 / NCFB 3025 / ST-74) TaxID=446469 RepID=D1BFW0_SANKS|nr:adenylate cyclase [Sanguibacter keddieii]ACZ21471.1 family 3 adenylate cyclase [Sanguibacter keddieii DSM 10542]
MTDYSKEHFGATVRENFTIRQDRSAAFEHAQLSARTHLETRSLGHPDFEDLEVGSKRSADMIAVFLDLSNFTGRTFWDDPDVTADLADAVLSGFIETVSKFGGYPLGLRGDGLFAGFTPGPKDFTAVMALGACAFALDAIEREVNPWLESQGLARLQARAGLDFGPITFIRTGSAHNNEINPIGFAANFAAKCEKIANSWEVVAGQGLVGLLPDERHFLEHERSPKRYTRDHETRSYKFFQCRWRGIVPHLPGVIRALDGSPTSEVKTC